MEENNAQNKPILHQPVLLHEVCDGLSLPRKRLVVDCTLGLGGHAKAILQNLAKTGKLIGFDLDAEHIKEAKKKLRSYGSRVTYVNANFSSLKDQLAKTRYKGIDGILFDLGMASTHVDQAEKGFSFLREGPLDMRFDHSQTLTAAEVVNRYPEKKLIEIFKEYGEEKRARRIAHEICRVRKRRPFKTTTQLAKFVERLLKRQGRIHPATRIFQALRIEVNKELNSLQSALQQAVELLRPKGRIAVISYHSLEDRIVKRFFKELSRDYVNLPGEMTTRKLKPLLKIVTKKPVVPAEEELAQNPRSRSAKLRIAEKL